MLLVTQNKSGSFIQLAYFSYFATKSYELILE